MRWGSLKLLPVFVSEGPLPYDRSDHSNVVVVTKSKGIFLMRYRHTDAIILLGLNPTASDEARALRSFGNDVMLISDGKRSDWVSVDGQAFDLADGDQVAA